MSITIKRPRKQRTVNNAYVDIDSVNINPGINYSNWIQLAKHKLKERDNRLLDIRLQKITTIVNNKLTYYNKNIILFRPLQKTIDHIFKQLRLSIDKWNGVIINRVKKNLNTFRKYFVIGRRCWNLQKSKLFGDVFWVPIVNDIQQHILENVPKQHVNIILSQIIHNLFNATVKFANTKETSLINSGTIIHGLQFQKWLYKMNNSININEWILLEKDKAHNKHKGVGQIIIHKLRTHLTMLLNSTNNDGNCESPPTKQTRTHTHTHTFINQPLLKNNCGIVHPTYMSNNNVNMFTTNLNQLHSYNTYNPCRGSAYTVREIRNNPLVPISCPMISSSTHTYPLTQLVPVNIQYQMGRLDFGMPMTLIFRQ